MVVLNKLQIIESNIKIGNTTLNGTIVKLHLV